MEQVFTGLSIKVSLGLVGAAIATALGGWGMALQTLIVFMGIDYVTGLCVAIFWKQSPKSTGGGFNSAAGLRGLIKKAVMLMGVWMAHHVDMIGGVDFIRTWYIIALCVNEFGSIGENFAIIGVPIPEGIMQVFDVLQSKKKE